MSNRCKYFLDEDDNLESASEKIAKEATEFFSNLFNLANLNNQFSDIICKNKFLLIVPKKA